MSNVANQSTVPSKPARSSSGSGTSLLHRALQIDFAITSICTVPLILAAGPLAAITGLPEMLILGSGLVFIPFLVLVGWLARRARPPRKSVWMVIALNVGWAVGSVIVLASGVLDPTALGYALVIAIALAVLVFAELEFFGLRRALTEG